MSGGVNDYHFAKKISYQPFWIPIYDVRVRNLYSNNVGLVFNGHMNDFP